MIISDKVSKIKKLKKEIVGKIKNGTEYKVKNLEFNNNDSMLFKTMEIKEKGASFLFDFTKLEGNIIINKESKRFYIIFSTETKYGFYDKITNNDFYNALVDFNEDHIYYELENKKIDKNGNLIMKRKIKII